MIKRFSTSSAAQFLSANSWAVISVFWGIGLALGVWGFLRHAAALGETISGLDALYLTLQLVPMNSGAVPQPVPWELEIARLFVPFMAAATAIKAVAGLFQAQIGLASIHLRRGHVVICGLGRTGFYLTQDYLRKGERLVILEQDPENPYLSACRSSGAVVITGNAADPTLLRQAAVQRARLLVAVCGDDGVNAEIAILAQEMMAAQPHGHLACRIHIADTQLRELLREREIHSSADRRFELEIFNIFERGGWLMCQQHAFLNDSHRQGNSFPRLIVVGLGRLGESLVVHAARIWWDLFRGSKQPLEMIVVDRLAQQKVDSLRLRYPQLERACTITAVQTEIDAPDFQSGRFLFDNEVKLRIDAVYICFDNDTLSLRAALILRQQLASQSIPIVVRTVESKGLAHLLAERGHAAGSFRSLHPFGLLPSTCTGEILDNGTHEILAQAIHASYVRQQSLEDQTVTTNPSMVPWEHLPENLKSDNRRQAYRYAAVLRNAGYGIETLRDWNTVEMPFDPTDIEPMAQQIHAMWKEDRENEGWTYTSGEKDIDRKLSPDLVAWQQLPPQEKIKNLELIRSLPEILYQANFQVRRL